MPTHSNMNKSDPANDSDTIFRRGRPVYSVMEKYSPTRHPKWRWWRAQDIANARRPLSAKTDDEWTRRAAKYLTEWLKCGDRQDARLLCKMPDIAVAHLLSEQGEMRWLAEARILGGEPVADVARHAGVEPDAITAFEKLFFNVSDRLECADYIDMVCLKQGCCNRHITLDDKAALLRLYAYYGGPIILHYVAPYILHPNIDLSLLSPEHAQLAPKIKRMLAMDTTQFTWATDKKSREYMQLNPPTVEDLQEMMLAAVERGDSVLRPVKSKRKASPAAIAKPSEPDEALRLRQSSGA